MMTITWTGLLIMLLIAGVCGAIGRAIAGGSTGGFAVSIVVGFIGAFIGGFIAHTLRLPEPFMVQVENHSYPIVWSIVGAAVLIAIAQIFTRRPRQVHA